MQTLHEIIWERIHYHGGAHNLGNAIEAELVKLNWHTVSPPEKTPKRYMWKQWELNFILLYWRCSKQKDIALRINRTRVAVVQKIYNLKRDGIIVN